MIKLTTWESRPTRARTGTSPHRYNEPMTAIPTLSEVDKVKMKAYFLAAKSWDKHRRALQREEENDPATNSRILDLLIEQAMRVHGGPLMDDPKEDLAESKLAHVLSQRAINPADR